MCRLKYIHEVKDGIVPFHEPVGKWENGFFVNIFYTNFNNAVIIYITST